MAVSQYRRAKARAAKHAANVERILDALEGVPVKEALNAVNTVFNQLLDFESIRASNAEYFRSDARKVHPLPKEYK